MAEETLDRGRMVDELKVNAIYDMDWDLAQSINPDPTAVIKTPGLYSVAESLLNNLRVIHTMIGHNPLLISLALIHQQIQDRAKLDVFRHLNTPDTYRLKPSEQGLFTAAILTHRKQHADASKADPESFQKAIRRGTDVLKIIAHENPLVLVGIHSVFVLMVINMWTVFESMAGDLWEASLNTHPQRLAALSGSRRRIGGRTAPRPVSDGDDDGKSINLNVLQKYGYDVSKAMGTVLRSKGKVGFTRLSDIREAYSVAFSDDANDIDKVLEDNALDAISAVRNLLVHKAGMVDEEFLQRSKAIPYLPRLSLGDKLQLDGDIVKKQIEPVIRLSVSLLQAVDAWIVRNTKSGTASPPVSPPLPT